MYIQRCDYLIKLFAFFILAIHWFNPWVSYYFMSKDIEMSCDEAVLNSILANPQPANPDMLFRYKGKGRPKNLPIGLC
ncbi:M56 family metallopeptidase [Lacrimispora brassicae]